FVFFFQAEDGIRDFHVTGVQTCALPISELRAASAMAGSDSPLVGRVERLLDADPKKKPSRFVRWMRVPLCASLLLAVALLAPEEIGRASCRERVEIAAGGGVVRGKVSDR